MKICFLTKNLNIDAGIGRYGKNIIDGLEGVETIVLTEKDNNSEAGKPVLSRSSLLSQLPNIFINAIRVRKYIKNCDIVHALDGYPYGIIATLAGISLNKRVIISGIGTYSVLPLDKPIKKILLKWAYKRAYRILCISNFTKNQILKRIKLNNLEVINLGVDYNKFQINYQKQNKEKIVLSVGALKPRKGYHISIPAIAEVAKKYPDIKYYIVGGKPSEIYLDLVKKYDLKKNVEFLQGLSDAELIKTYNQSDIFLLTPVTINDNDFEGFGLVYLEAGACGKPVIGAFGSGAEDAIIDRETGILVPQNDIQKTAEAIIKLLDNPDMAKRMGEDGKERARQMTWESVIAKYLSEYEFLSKSD